MRHPSTADAVPPPDREDLAAKEPKPRRAQGERKDRAATRPAVEGRSAPRMPHERDESSDSGSGGPSDLGKRAHDDAASGKTGTDKGEATDEVYRRSLRGSTPGAERD